jgi:succinate-acetate transporter protein
VSTDTEAATVAPATPAIADPAPLGLAAFALTTFLLSAINAGLAKTSTGFDWWGYAIAFGGLGQLLAGMWEFRNQNVFGATAFSTYGGFWIGVGLWLHFIAPGAKNPVALNRDLGWILLGFAIINTYLLIISTQLNMAVFLVFLTLELTEIFLFLGNFTTKVAALPPDPTSSSLIVIGGYLGIVTAAVAWYTSAAGVINGIKGGVVFPVGKPLMNLAPRA